MPTSTPNKSASATLPVELVDYILELVDSTRDKLSLCLANSFMRDIALRHLYRSIRLRHCLSTMRLCHALLSRPSLALYVHSLRIGQRVQGKWTFVPACHRLLFRAVQAMTNLKDLTVCRPQPSGLQYSENIGRSAPQLTRISFEYGKYIDLALRRLTSLEELIILSTMPSNYAFANLPSNALTSLRRLQCGHTLFPMIVPQRNIDCVSVWDVLNTEWIRPCLEVLSQSRVPLKDLSLAAKAIGLDTFQQIGLLHSQLEELALNDVSSVPVVAEVLQHPETLTYLSNLSSLRRFRIFCTLAPVGDEIGSFVTQLGAQHPALSQFAYITYWELNRRYEQEHTAHTYDRIVASREGEWQYRVHRVHYSRLGDFGW